MPYTEKRTLLTQFACFSAVAIINISLSRSIPSLDTAGRETVNNLAPLIFLALSLAAYLAFRGERNILIPLTINPILLVSITLMFAIAVFIPEVSALAISLTMGSIVLAYSAGLSVVGLGAGNIHEHPKAAALGGISFGLAIFVLGTLSIISYFLAAMAAIIVSAAGLACGDTSMHETNVIRSKKSRNVLAMFFYVSLLFTAFGVAFSRNFQIGEEMMWGSPLYGIMVVFFSLIYAGMLSKVRYSLFLALPVFLTTQLSLQIGSGMRIFDLLLEPGIIASLPFLIVYSYELHGKNRAFFWATAIIFFAGAGAILGRALPQISAVMLGILCLVGAILIGALMPKIWEPGSKDEEIREYLEIAKEVSRQK